MLRALLSRKKTEQFAKYKSIIENDESFKLTKINEEQKLLKKLENTELFK